MGTPLLEVKDLHTYFIKGRSVIPAVNGISFTVAEGETLAIVGESGCGKSVASLSILGLVAPPGKVVKGEVRFQGRDLLRLGGKEMRRIRGAQISMIFQEPMTSLNPVFTIGQQIGEVLCLHMKLNKKQARAKSKEMLDLVGIPNAGQVLDYYPHQLSGGMRQRVMISIALACNPRLMIADEPTTALDVTIQAQILELMKELCKNKEMSLILITHDLGVVAEMADRVIVMYAGQIVESALVEQLFEKPLHPYTKGLIGSIPDIRSQSTVLANIPGNVPNPLDLPSGCAFEPRCPYADEACRADRPDLAEAGDGRWVRCIHAGGEGA